MDPRTNPYAPGAGTQPPELAGRDDIIERAAIALDRIRLGRTARSFIFYGLRGVGKTVLLNRIRTDSEARGFAAVRIEAPEGRSLPAVLLPPLRSSLLRLNRTEAAKSALKSAFGAMASFARTLKIKFQDIEFGIELEPIEGIADSGDLDNDLSDLLTTVGKAARDAGTTVVLFVDELQYVPEGQLASLITALHNTSQDRVPITMMAAGLPQLLGMTGRAKSYAERLFEFTAIDKLDDQAAKDALCIPAHREGVDFQEAAIADILHQTLGYPYFLQEWGKHSWDAADTSPIELDDTQTATQNALAELDASFFRVRFDRLTPLEKRYVHAMALLGAGPHRSGDIADRMGRTVTSMGPLRNSLIAKGMIYSPAHGDTAFTVPLFDGFIRRIMD